MNKGKRSKERENPGIDRPKKPKLENLTEVQSAIDSIKGTRKARNLGKISVRSLIEDGRRR